MQLKRAVITGLGVVSPVGNSVEEYWKSHQQGLSGAAEITLFDAAKFKTRFACEVKGFDPLDYLDRKEARKMDRFSQFAIASADQAIADSGFKDSDADLNEVGVIWGAGIGGMDTFFSEAINLRENDYNPRFSPFFIPKVITDIAPGHISIRHGFRGMNFATVSACASSTNSLIDALNYIRLGKADIIVAGGSEACVAPSGVGGFNAMHALSVRNDDPQTASRPFDKDRDGFVLGEGGACPDTRGAEAVSIRSGAQSAGLRGREEKERRTRPGARGWESGVASLLVCQ